MRQLRIAIVAFGALLGAFANSANAQFLYVQSESYDSEGRYSFISPGSGMLGQFDVAYVRSENPRYGVGSKTGTTNPAFLTEVNVSATQFGGQLGYTLGKTSDELAQILGEDFRVVASGHYWQGNEKVGNITEEDTLVIAINGSGQGRSITDATRNEFDAFLSQTDASLCFQGDHYRDDGIVLTKSIGFSYMRLTSDYYYDNYFEGSGNQISSLSQLVGTNFAGLDTALAARYRYNQYITFFGGASMTFYSASTKFDADQTINGIGQYSVSEGNIDDKSQFGVKPRGELGIFFETDRWNAGALFFYEHVSYNPYVVNAFDGNDPPSYFIAESSNLYGVKLTVGTRW